MKDQFPALVIILPILFSLVYLAFFRRQKPCLFVMIFHITMGYVLFCYYPHIADETNISYFFGGWSPPYGIEFVINKVSYVFLCLMYFVSFMASVFIYGKLEQFVCKNFSNKFFAIYFILLAGFGGIILTNDMFNLYVFIEISAIATYSLASISDDRYAIKSSLNYLILGTFAATLILLGIGFIYSDVGTLNIGHIAQILLEKQSTDFISKVGFFFIIIGLIIKFALFPFHKWLVGIYLHSSPFITFFYSAISTKIMIVTLYKMQLAFFNGNLLSYIGVDKILLVLSLASIMLGSVVALYQNNLKKMLSYSSISQIGYMGVAIILFPNDSYVIMALFISHALAKMALFMFESITCDTTISKDKVSHVTLFTLLTYVILSASIIGIPGTYGFTAKFYLLKQLFATSNYTILGIMIIAGVFALLYFFKFFEFFYSNFNIGPKNSGIISVNYKQKVVLLSVTITLVILVFIEKYIQAFLGI